MFVKPIDALVLSAGSWLDHAGNPHFALQSRKHSNNSSNLMFMSLFSGFISNNSTTSFGTIESDAARLKRLAEFDFRIVLRSGGLGVPGSGSGAGKKKDYVVAVAESFEAIHSDWNWVEENLTIKLAELETLKKGKENSTATYTSAEIDSFLLKQFEELNEEFIDSKAIAHQKTVTEIKSTIMKIFPGIEDEELLNYYSCSYLASENLAIRGQLGIMKNYVCYFNTKHDGVDCVSLCIPFKDILNLELVNSKRVLGPDAIQISIKDKSFSFALYFNRKDVYRILFSLANAAMNRLVKGAETSISASSDMYAKGNTTGDLASNLISRGGGGLLGRPREELSFTTESPLALTDNLEEEDFTEHHSPQLGSSVLSNSRLEALSIGGKLESESVPKSTSTGTSSAGKSETTKHSLLNYAQIVIAKIHNIDDLDFQIRHIEFRSLFRLPISETISLEEIPCYIWNKTGANQSVSGNLYLSQNFINFASLSSQSVSTIVPLSISSSGNAGLDMPNVMISPGLSMLFDSSQEPTLVFAIPYPHVVSVMKQAPTALTSSFGKIQNISLSGFLVLSTKSRQEFWLSFGSTKSRDRVADMILQKMKQVDWRFDDDVNVGVRNGGPNATATSPGSLSRRLANLSNSFENLDEGMGMVRDSAFSAHIHAVGGISTQILQNGLKFMFETEGSTSPRASTPDTERAKFSFTDKKQEQAWNDYLESNGKDVCMTKDLKTLRELLLRSDGIPTKLRGDLWMLFSGAWHSRPEKDYYRKLVHENLGRVSPFTEEIEKDVRRSLPEHPAYQSPVGIDALRRLLTAYSWRNPTLGYAQALNIISAVLLLHLREEDAFWMLCTIVERILPDHYTKTLVGSVVDQSVFSHLVQTYMPNLWAHLTKLYMDLSMVSVPWFVCLFLNSVPLKVGTKILDCFFLDGPKFLFWMALSVLKVNEKKLIQKGKDDDIFVRILKEFFQRLGAAESSTVANATPTTPTTANENDPSMLIGRSLFEYTLSVAYGSFAHVVTTDTIQYLRMKYRLKVVHQMEDASRKSQVRTLAEQVALTLEEVGIIYDEVRTIEFLNEELAQEDSKEKEAIKMEEEEEIKTTVFREGGWGMVSKARRTRTISSNNSLRIKPTAQTTKVSGENDYQKSIRLIDFRKVFEKVSPWRGATVHKKATKSKEPSFGISSSPPKRSEKTGMNNNTQPKEEDLQLQLSDRIYFYCALHYHFLQSRGATANSNRSSFRDNGDTNSSVGGAGMGTDNSSSKSAYTVDLATIVHVLDIIMKQPLQSRMRFLFDVHDLDGDGFLSKSELKAVMDSLLEMFERAKQDGFGKLGVTNSSNGNAANGETSMDSNSERSGNTESNVGTSSSSKPLEDDELYLRAVSAFLNTALKLGNNKASSSGTTGTGSGTSSLSGMKKSSSMAFSSLETEPSKNLSTISAMEEDEGELDDGIGETLRGSDRYRTNSEIPIASDTIKNQTQARRARRSRSASVSSPSGGSNDDFAGKSTSRRTSGMGLSYSRSVSEQHGQGGNEETFTLSFNEFLLAVLSQSVFVQFFERNWKLRRGVGGESSGLSSGKPILDW
ncbi:TBC1 domain member 9 [Nowakowskiella sp. JEL0407]|nr:TBC1 domain member 9 [Nowakowskiella sp. JEL0407]